MVDRIGPVNAVANAPQYDGRWERQLRDTGLAMGSSARPLGARTGVRPGTPSTTVTATSTTWTCAAFSGVADVEAAAEAGAYPFSFDAAATGAMTPADGTNARIDIIYVQIDDPSEDGSATPAVTRKYLAGQAGSGVAPTPPVARAFVIAEINVPKSGAGAPSVTWKPPYTAAAGATVPINTVAEMAAWLTAPKRQRVDVIADPAVGNNGVWQSAGGGTFERVSAICAAEYTYAVNGHPNATLFNTPGLTLDPAKTYDQWFSTVVSSKLRLSAGSNGPAIYLVEWTFVSSTVFTGRSLAELTSTTNPDGMRFYAGAGENKISASLRVVVPSGTADVTFNSFVAAGGTQNLTGRVTVTRIMVA